MSFDLYEQENLEAVSNLPPVQDVEPSFFAGMSQVPKLAMRSLAVAGRAGSMAAASVPVLMDRLTGDTTLEDKYFKFHEDTFQSAVDYWTPRPNEVGTAAQVVGDLVTTLPMAIAAPPIALGSAYLGASEDLVRQGVDPLKAQAVGATQAAGFALGIWMPILGKNLWQRTVVGGAGFNVLQGAVTRGVSGEMLEGTPAEGQFKAFDGEAMTLDVLMGLGFGTFAHLSPSQRAQGEEAWNKISEWAQNMTPSQKAAVATLREAQHMNVDSTPGKPIDPSDIEAHVNRMRTAIDQIVNDQPVDVENILVPGRTKDEPDDPLKALSDTTLQAVGDLGPGREITRGVGVTDADWALLEKEGLVQEGTTEDGEKYHYVSTDALVGERERRYQAEVQARKNRTIDPEEQAAAVERRAANYERVAAEKTEAGYPDEADQLTAKAKELRAQAKAIRENALPHEPQFQPDPVREQENVERTRQMLDIAEQVRHDEGLPEVSQVGRTITERLMELGTPAQEAADKGLLWDTFFKSMEARTGKPADELMGKYFDRVFNAGEALPEKDGTFSGFVFEGKQLKSASRNRGTFDPNDPNILKQFAGDGARGFLEFGQNGKMGIGLLASADKSTFLHESGHFFLEVMNDLSNEANAPPELRADMQAIHEWMGVSREQWASMSLEQKRPYHEQWTRGFEQYLMEGKAPTSRLKEAFARFRDWLIEIYKSATALNVTLSDDVRKVMDNMLTVKESEPRQSPTGDGVPPPRASIGEDSAGNSDLDKALTSGEPLLDKIRPLDDPDLVATLQDMAANEAGWAEKGGNLMREFGDEGEVTGRTQWIPKAEWWPDRPGAGKANRKLNEAQVAEAVRKHLAGEPLKSLELQTVEYMSKIANDRLNSVEMIGDQEFGNTMQDWVAESVEPTTEKVFDSQAVARALDLNPEATMQAMERYDIHDDDAIIMAEIRSIIDEAGQQSLETAQGRAEDTGKEADPIQSEAERIVAEDPERRIPIGTGPDGEAVTLTAREYLDQARAQADQARQDVNLIKAAAECLLGQI